MVVRQRTLASGFYDPGLKRFVRPMTLVQAATNIDLRHKMLTGADQHIEKKTLDDYYGYIRSAYEGQKPFDFHKNSHKNISALRKHCLKYK